MATLDELYTTVLADEAEKAAFAQAAKTAEGLSAFLAERGCAATPEQVAAFLKEKQAAQGEMSDAELESVAGGCNTREALYSTFSVGLCCAVLAGISASADQMTGENGEMLCRGA